MRWDLSGRNNNMDIELGVWLTFLKKNNFADKFWTWSAEALIFLMTRPFCEYKQFRPITLTLEFDLFLNLLMNFEHWMLELWYLIWVFHISRHFRGNHELWPCDLDLGGWPVFKENLNFA